MTTLGIIADVHGNLPALEAVVAATADQVDEWVCAGDLVGHLPMINEVIDKLRSLNAHCVRGNHDAALLSGRAIPSSSAATRALQIQRGIITPESRRYLETLPERLDLDLAGVRLTVMHGGPHDVLDEKVRTVDDDVRQAARGGVLILGHTHRPMIDVHPDYAVLNPGAVGLPVDGEKRARVILLDLPARHVRLLEIPYDPGPVLTRLAVLGYDERYANCLREGRWVGFTHGKPRAPILIAGASTYGELIAELAAGHDAVSAVGFVDDTPARQGTSFAGLPVLGKIDDLGRIAAEAGVTDVAVAIGDSASRQHVAGRVREQGVRLATLVHPKAYVSPSARLGPGVIVDALAYVGTHCVLEEGVSVWPTVSISHDIHVGSYASLMAGSVIGGFSKVMPGVKVAMHSTWPSYSTVAEEPVVK